MKKTTSLQGLSIAPSFPNRIICLTEETTETLYLLGAQERIVGISGFTVRPKEARKEKPKVGTYLEANMKEILKLKPDIVLAWSDLQADTCADLIREGIEVICFNQRSISDILGMMLRLGALVGKRIEAEDLVDGILKHLQGIEKRGKARKYKPRVYFEEWYDPLITGSTWVSELIELCGGEDIFIENRNFHDAKRRIIADPTEVIRRNPDIMLASWCGKMLKKERVIAREGWSEIRAVKEHFMFDLISAVILQPGPAALTDGTNRIMAIFDTWEQSQEKSKNDGVK